MNYELPTLSEEARARIKRRLLADARQIRLWKASSGILGALLAFVGSGVAMEVSQGYTRSSYLLTRQDSGTSCGGPSPAARYVPLCSAPLRSHSYSRGLSGGF